MSSPQPAGELRILIGGFLEECIGQLIAEIIKKNLSYTRVAVQTIESLPDFLKTAAQSPPDLFLRYLYFGDPAAEVVNDPASLGRVLGKQHKFAIRQCHARCSVAGAVF